MMVFELAPIFIAFSSKILSELTFVFMSFEFFYLFFNHKYFLEI